MPESDKAFMKSYREPDVMLSSDYSGRSEEERQYQETMEEKEEELQLEEVGRILDEEANEISDKSHGHQDSDREPSLDIADNETTWEKEGTSQESFYDEFEIGGMTKQEIITFNKIAPVGQKLEDAVAENVYYEKDGELHRVPQISVDAASDKSRKEAAIFQSGLDAFIRQHSFTILLNNNEPFKTAQRRAFERELYDFIRSYGLSPLIAREILRQVKSQWQPATDDSQTEWEGEELDEVNQAKHLIMKHNNTIIDKRNQHSNGTEEYVSNAFESNHDPTLQSSLAAIAKDIAKLEAALLGPLSLKSQALETQNRMQTQKDEQTKKHNDGKRQKKLLKEKAKSGYTSKVQDKSVKALKKAHRKAKRERRARRKNGMVAQQDGDKLQPYKAKYSFRGNIRLSDSKEEQIQSLLVNAAEDSSTINEREGAEKHKQMSREQIAKIDAEIRGIRDFSNAKQVELYENEGMKGADKEMKNDLEEKKQERNHLRDTRQQTIFRKRKRTSNVNENVANQPQHSQGAKDKKQKEVSNNEEWKPPYQSQLKNTDKDFRLPMKQRV